MKAAVEEKKRIGQVLERKAKGVKTIWSMSGDDACLEITSECLLEVARMLKQEKTLDFSFLACITGVDRYEEEPRFELIYHLRSLRRKKRLVLKTRVPLSCPVAPSVIGVWKAADWMEREVYDLLGIAFDGHPDMRRILMPEDWEGYPLRKDCPLEGKRTEFL